MSDWLDDDLMDKHSLDMRQFMDFRESRLPNGMRIIEAYNSSGLTFTLLPDRGMDIWSAQYKGMPLTWLAPGSPHPPDYGASWLRIFNGGLLATCGLTHVGPPEDGRDIHGNYTRLQAHHIAQTGFENRALILAGSVVQSQLFSEQLQLKRRYSMRLGQPIIEIRDQVSNIGDQPAPFMLLYHCNLGYPLIREGTELIVASDVYPRDDEAQAGVETWNRYTAAAPDYAEQVFFHRVKQEHNQTRAALLNEDMGLKFAWDTDQLPYLTQWKNTRQGIYICGIEPGNCLPEGQNAARESGRLLMLQPGETHDFSLTLSVLDGADALQQCRQEIQQLQANGRLVANSNFSGYTKYEAS